MNRRLITLWTGTLIVASSFSAASGAQSSTLGPDSVGWWSAARPVAALPAAAPPDVGEKDLYVAGANALPGQLARPTGAGPAAIAALRFRLPADASVEELRLKLAGTRPPAVTMTACRTTEAFTAVYGGAWSDAPAYDCTDAGTARLEADGEVVIDGVDGLRQGQDLAVVLVPGPLDRVVVAAPDAQTLRVSSSPSAGGSGIGPAPLPPSGPMSPAAPAGGTGAGASGLAPALPGAAPGAALAPAPSLAAEPVVADSAPAPQAATAAVELPARPWATLLATALIALLAFAAMVNPRGAAGAGGAPGAVGVRGVGRFRSEREGRVPDLA